MPVLFVGHGSPMNAIEQNEFSRGWESVGASLPTPSAILCVSAHWQTLGTQVTAMERPRTIHDFGGFPKELFAAQYPAPGAPAMAQETTTVSNHPILLDHEWGLDHGAWSVLMHLFPKANIPTYQLSLDIRMSPDEHVAVARDLASLRNRGVLILGSGNIVHNLRQISWEGKPYAWAEEFDAVAAKLIESRDVKALAHYEKLGAAAGLSIPTNEHYLPMLYTLAMQDAKDELSFFNTGIDHGSISMRSFILK